MENAIMCVDIKYEPPSQRALSSRDQRLEHLFRTEASFVWRVVRRFGVSEADAEDVTQEVFLVAAKRFDTYEDRGCPRAWLVAIARQLSQHSVRAQLRRERKVRELPTLQVISDPQRALECNEAAAFVNDFLSELDKDQALVFWLAELEGMSAPEIAAGLQVKLNTVYGRLRLARKRFEAKVKRKARREG